MKAKYLFLAMAISMALLSSAWAASIAGKWTAQAQDIEITLTFKVDGTALTGTVDNPQAGPAEIKDGKINGDDISFYVVRKMGETEIKLVWKGKIAGDEIKFTRETQGGTGGPGGGAATNIIAKRAK
jgi:hypothetical protein